MNQAVVDKLVRAVMYEGYMLYPYRPSLKNRHRWTFGTLYPRAYSEAHGGSDAWSMHTECLVSAPAHARLRVKAHFLQLINRTVGELSDATSDSSSRGAPAFRQVDSLRIDERTIYPWQEAIEREMCLSHLSLGELCDDSRAEEFEFESANDFETLRDAAGRPAGLILRERQKISASVEIEAKLLEPGLFKLTIQICNQTGCNHAAGITRDEVLAHSLLSTHLILTVEDGEFVSLIDPPQQWRQAAAECRNIGNFPVLLGSARERDTMLCSPIILYDYPQVAPESPTDFFDACEIDELLAMRLNTLTDQEKQAMIASDARTRSLLERAESLNPAQMALLHGAVRELRPIVQLSYHPESEDKKRDTVRVNGIELRAGDLVRLHPRRSADAFDILLDGKIATIASIEEDFDGRIHVAVTVQDDPGADLGAAGKIGHRFFFLADEIEPHGDRQRA